MRSLGPHPSILPFTGHPSKIASTGWGLCLSEPMGTRLGAEVVMPTHALPPQSLYPEVV